MKTDARDGEAARVVYKYVALKESNRPQRGLGVNPNQVPLTHRYTSEPFACLEKSRRPEQETSPDKAKGLQRMRISDAKSGTWYFLPMRSVSVCLTGQPNPLCMICIVKICIG